jgi:hypothetical protein
MKEQAAVRGQPSRVHEAVDGDGPRAADARATDAGHPAPQVALGEVIEADTLRFRAECSRLYAAPPFGSFVRVEGSDHGGGADSGSKGRRPPAAIYGVVFHMSTGAIDPGRQTQALHLPPERLSERMPQLALVLRTCFTAVVVGHVESGVVCPYLPPQPPEIHRFVAPCALEEVEALTREPDFLRVLAAAEGPVEDLLAAAIRHAAEARGTGRPADEFIVACGKTLALLFRREPDRFQSVMRRVQAARRPAAPWEEPLLR